MTIINLLTEIRAPISQCFDLARSVDIHLLSAAKTNERAIAGRTSGLCELGDTVTWEATHFGVKQKLTVEITRFERPHSFEDRMVRGAFRSMKHEHRFEEQNGITVMSDKFEYEVPLGFLGILFDGLILNGYIRRFLIKRNDFIRSSAEKQT